MGVNRPFWIDTMAALPPFEKKLRGAIAEIPCVLHVVGDRVCATEFIADVLGHDRGLDAERLEMLLDLMFEEVAEVDLRETKISVLISFHIRQSVEVLRVHTLDQALRQDSDPIGSAHSEPLQNMAPMRMSTSVAESARAALKTLQE